jgi:hypothetical protein
METTTSIQDQVVQVVTDLGHDTFTPYLLTKVINTVGALHGLPTVREQMMYNYRTKGLLGKNLVDGKMTSHDVVEFVTRFVTKRVTK